MRNKIFNLKICKIGQEFTKKSGRGRSSCELDLNWLCVWIYQYMYMYIVVVAYFLEFQINRSNPRTSPVISNSQTKIQSHAPEFQNHKSNHISWNFKFKSPNRSIFPGISHSQTNNKTISWIFKLTIQNPGRCSRIWN